MGKYEWFFNEIASSIDLTDTEEETITRSYQAVGEFLHNSEHLSMYEPHIFPQGSMRIGTTIKPLKTNDYDIDLVCELTKHISVLNPQKVKQLVGVALRTGKYCEQLQKEHGRCWTLDYSANPPYHLDILPAVSTPEDRVNATKIDAHGNYIWLPTNPKGFAKWFLALYKSKTIFDEHIGVEKVNIYGSRNPLQRAVQLIKRHRDVYFRNRIEDGPASIIITTLTGLSYKNETTIEDILRNGPITWISHIKKENGKYYIKVPGLKDDNYADKWNGEDKDAPKIFLEWYSVLIRDLDSLFAQTTIYGFLKVAKRMFLDGTVDRVLNENYTLHDSLDKSFGLNAPMVLEDKHPLYKHALSIKNDGHTYIPNQKIVITIKGRVFGSEEDRAYNLDSTYIYEFKNYSPLLERGMYIRFNATILNAPSNHFLRWQITNTGFEASCNGSDSLRGGFENSSERNTRFEYTSYAGTHFVQAFVIDSSSNKCVAKSNILMVNIGDF